MPMQTLYGKCVMESGHETTGGVGVHAKCIQS